MNKKLINLLLAFLILTGFTQQSLAEGWYVGGGIVKASFEDDLQSIDSGNGLAFNGGFGFNENFSVDLLSGISIHDGGIFTGDIAQGFIMAGGKFSFGTDTFRPYLLAGISLHIVDFEFFTEDITGNGVYWGVGADIFVSKQGALNFSLRSSDWDGEDSLLDYNVTTEIVTIAYNFYFSR